MSQTAPELQITPQQAAENLIAEVEKDPKRKLTATEHKTLMRQMWTVRRQRVVQCGHRYDSSNLPRHDNCEWCWFAFFQNHGEVVQQFDAMFQEHGFAAVQKLIGTKATKQWLRFMATVATMVKQGENGEGTEGSKGNTEGREETGSNNPSNEQAGSVPSNP